jgi:hypothetical protein
MSSPIEHFFPSELPLFSSTFWKKNVRERVSALLASQKRLAFQ